MNTGHSNYGTILITDILGFPFEMVPNIGIVNKLPTIQITIQHIDELSAIRTLNLLFNFHLVDNLSVIQVVV